MSSALLGQLGGSAALASAAGASLGIKNPGDMYVSLFRSQTVEDSLIRRFGLMVRYRTKRMSDTRTAFENRSTVVFGVKDGLIRISVTDPDPTLAAEIANGYVEEFRKLSANLAITEASQRRIFFQQQLLEANEGLATAEEAMKHTEQSTGVLQIDSQARALIESAETLRAQVAAKEVQLQGMRSYATEDNPQMVTAEQQLIALKAQLAKLSGMADSSNSDIIVPKGNIPQAGMEYIRKLRDEKYYETIVELIAKQFEMAKLDEARQGSMVQVADIALPPDKKSSPHRAIIVALMTLIAFVTSTLWVLAAVRWEQTLVDPAKGGKIETLRQLLLKKQR
jgi:capsule polysaccharide export protein KpsE/RkpR